MELNGRTVIVEGIDGVDSRDYPDFCDAFFSEAFYKDNGQALSDEELEKLQDLYPEVVNEMAFESLI
jgi:hypothetical protein